MRQETLLTDAASRAGARQHPWGHGAVLQAPEEEELEIKSCLQGAPNPEPRNGGLLAMGVKPHLLFFRL